MHIDGTSLGAIIQPPIMCAVITSGPVRIYSCTKHYCLTPVQACQECLMAQSVKEMKEYLPWQWTHRSWNYWSNLGSVHQVPITAGWTKAVWNMKFSRHIASTGNRSPDLLILSPTSYPLGYMPTLCPRGKYNPCLEIRQFKRGRNWSSVWI